MQLFHAYIVAEKARIFALGPAGVGIDLHCMALHCMAFYDNKWDTAILYISE